MRRIFFSSADAIKYKLSSATHSLQQFLSKNQIELATKNSLQQLHKKLEERLEQEKQDLKGLLNIATLCLVSEIEEKDHEEQPYKQVKDCIEKEHKKLLARIEKCAANEIKSIKDDIDNFSKAIVPVLKEKLLRCAESLPEETGLLCPILYDFPPNPIVVVCCEEAKHENKHNETKAMKFHVFDQKRFFDIREIKDKYHVYCPLDRNVLSLETSWSRAKAIDDLVQEFKLKINILNVLIKNIHSYESILHACKMLKLFKQECERIQAVFTKQFEITHLINQLKLNKNIPDHVAFWKQEGNPSGVTEMMQLIEKKRHQLDNVTELKKDIDAIRIARKAWKRPFAWMTRSDAAKELYTAKDIDKHIPQHRLRNSSHSS